ncbi:MAG: twin-arginine translocation signal domain-containing protein, partial [Thermoguttaceae bacterium]|nr:twin-arginine translocation signal domain-containing protein [Thermoguttaceae bacterium]
MTQGAASMTTYLSRRDFLRASALVSASVALNLPSVSRAQAQETTKNWY